MQGRACVQAWGPGAQDTQFGGQQREDGKCSKSNQALVLPFQAPDTYVFRCVLARVSSARPQREAPRQAPSGRCDCTGLTRLTVARARRARPRAPREAAARAGVPGAHAASPGRGSAKNIFSFASCLQGAFRSVAAEADASAKDLAALLKRRMAADRGAAAECIPLVRRLGEPIESLQARPGAPLGHAGPPSERTEHATAPPAALLWRPAPPARVCGAGEAPAAHAARSVPACTPGRPAADAKGFPLCPARTAGQQRCMRRRRPWRARFRAPPGERVGGCLEGPNM